MSHLAATMKNMGETQNDSNSEGEGVKPKRWRKGDVHPETGRLFWQYAKKSKNGEQWVPKETFERWKADYSAKSAERYQKNKTEDTPKRRREAHLKNREKHLKKMKEYRQKNLERVRELNREYGKVNRHVLREKVKLRRKTDPLFALKVNVRIRMWQAINAKGYTRRNRASKLLGCDWETLMAHIEGQFKEGMSWERRGDFHIDHIIPLASAKTLEEVEALCHYTNLQPLWAEENRVKRDKMPYELI